MADGRSSAGLVFNVGPVMNGRVSRVGFSASTRVSWRRLNTARRRVQPGLQRVGPSWPACRFNACAMRGRVRVRAITPSSPFLFGYSKISFSFTFYK